MINGESVPGEQELARMLRERVPGLRGFLINSNREQTNVVLGKSFRTVWGSEEITDVLCGLTFRISVRSTRSTGSRRRFYMGLRRGMRSLPERKPYWICIAEQVR